MGILKSELLELCPQENDIIISSGPHKVDTQYCNGDGPQQHGMWSSNIFIKDQQAKNSMVIWGLQLGSAPLLTCLLKLLASAHHTIHPCGPFVQAFIYLNTVLTFCLILGLDSAALCQAGTQQQQQPQQCLSKDFQLVGDLTTTDCVVSLVFQVRPMQPFVTIL